MLAVPLEELERSAFWRGLRLDIVIVFTWLRQLPILQALNKAGVYVVAKGDSDGLGSVPVFPAHHFHLMMQGPKTPWERAKSLRHWLRRRQDKEADREVISCLNIADKTAVETDTAKSRLGRFLAHHHRDDLYDRILVSPHPVSDDILLADVTVQKADRVVAIGRWDDPQKDTPLLVKSVEMFLKRHPDAEFIFIGRGGENVFAALTRRYPQVRYIGSVPRSEISSHLAASKIVLITSVWESFHIAAHEAVSLGCTVVGPPVIPVLDICRAGSFGTMARGRRPWQVAEALECEMKAWAVGDRDPLQIASFWRPRLSGKFALEQMLSDRANTWESQAHSI